MELLRQAADAMNLLILAEALCVVDGQIAERTNMNMVEAESRVARFGAKILCGAIPQLWLQITLWGISESFPLIESVNLFIGIALSYYLILVILPTQWRFARLNIAFASHKHN